MTVTGKLTGGSNAHLALVCGSCKRETDLKINGQCHSCLSKAIDAAPQEPVAQDDEAYGDDLLEQAAMEAGENFSMTDKMVAALGRIVRNRLALREGK